MVQAIPQGYHSVTCYLIVPNSVEAMALYRQAFGAEEVMRMPGPDGQSTMHAEIRIGDSFIMLSDENPQWDSKSPKTLGGSPVGLHLYVEDADAVYQQALKAGCAEVMAPQDMFWGDRYGKVRDPYGHLWGIATHQEDVSPEEMERRAAEMFCASAQQ
jgi:PhnB protein